MLAPLTVAVFALLTTSDAGLLDGEWLTVDGGRRELNLWFDKDAAEPTLRLEDVTLGGKGPTVYASCVVSAAVLKGRTLRGKCTVSRLRAGPSLNEREFVSVESASWARAFSAPRRGVLLQKGKVFALTLDAVCEEGRAARKLCLDGVCATLVAPQRSRGPGPPFELRPMRCDEDPAGAL